VCRQKLLSDMLAALCHPNPGPVFGRLYKQLIGPITQTSATTTKSRPDNTNPANQPGSIWLRRAAPATLERQHNPLIRLLSKQKSGASMWNQTNMLRHKLTKNASIEAVLPPQHHAHAERQRIGVLNPAISGFKHRIALFTNDQLNFCDVCWARITAKDKKKSRVFVKLFGC